MLIKDLGGHSGCKIYLYENENEYFVRKISASKAYNERLGKQCLKQEKFLGNTIKTPKVLNKGYNEEGLFYFDMEYIKGITLAKYITKIDVSEIADIAKIIINNIEFTLENSCSSDVFYEKLHNLSNSLNTKTNRNLKKAFDYLLSYNWNDFSSSSCHGDLTLENIIVKNGELYYIDFLDSFYESWLLDIGKLLQDTECMWSFRSKEKIDVNTKLRLSILKRIILSKIQEIDTKYIKDSYAALLLDLLRIYPYVKDEGTYSFLNKQVLKVLEILGGA